MKSAWGSLAAVCALVIAVYACLARSAAWESLSPNAADSYYNLLVRGFRAGQLNLKKVVPPGLIQLADPYDSAANARFCIGPDHLVDLSYYKGRLYLYFGVTPALILLWPFVALTGHYLFDGQAAAIFCAFGFLAGGALLFALWRRYFAEVSVWVVVAGTLALGLGIVVPVMLPGSEVYEVAVSCGYALTMLALAAIWKALHEPERKKGWWLAAASVAYGLALGARPSLLFGAVILLVPVAQAWRERRPIWAALMAATGPIILIGLGLMLYNALRFDNPFEFGWRYQLNASRQITAQQFSLRFLWFNFRVYFLEPARWGSRFPFVHDITLPPLPVGQEWVQHPFGLLTNIPLVWLALAVPLAWRGRSADVRSTLCGFLAAVALLFGIGTLAMSLFWAACIRYEMEFLPWLVLLAVVGIFGLERTLADRRVWRRAARLIWGLLLGFSVAFNMFASSVRYAEVDNDLGVTLVSGGRVPEGIARYEQALRLDPDEAAAHNNFGLALASSGRVPEAIAQYEQALRIKPNYPVAHYNLGLAFGQAGRLPEAMSQYEQALRIKPDYGDAHNNLGIALAQAGRLPEAIQEYEQAIQIEPDSAEAHYNLGKAFLQERRLSDAIGQYEQALRINPDYAAAHYNLGVALAQTGRIGEAIAHFEQALRSKPGDPEVQNNLAWLLATHAPSAGGDPVRAVTLAERACALTGNSAFPYLDTLAAAYAAAGRFDAAVATAQKAIDLARSAGQTNLVKEIEVRLELYRSGRAYSQSTAVTSPGNP